MEKIIDLWAIIWPILKEVFQMMNVGEKVLSFFLYFLIYAILWQIIKTLLPFRDSGSLLDRVVFPMVGFFLSFVPFIVLYNIFKENYPILSQLLSFITKFFGLDELIRALILSVFMAVLFYAIASFFWHIISVGLQWIFGDIPVLGPIFERLIIGLEVLAIMSTLMVAPVYGLSFFQERDPYPILISTPIILPPDVDENIWEVIETGVRSAQANEVACDPYLLYSLKVYETGENFCDQAWENKPRPNSCVSYAGALGMWQFMPETFQRNAERHDVEGTLWNPAIAAEVACYFINDEVNISLSQLRDVFIGEFSSIGFVWNRDPGGARVVYDRANQLREDALSQLPETDSFKGYLWPGPEDSFLWYKWGIQMWYGSFHNGIDVAIPGLKTFDVLAISTGVARYYDGGSCNMGVIHFKSIKNEEFYYVHMSAEPSDIYIPTNGSWVPVLTGQKLGRIHEGDTTCSIGSHLHFMYTDGRYIGEEMFNR